MGVSAFAQYAVWARPSLVKIDSDLPLEEAALFGCAVLTGVGAVVNTARVVPGSSVAVVGLGGVGLNALLGACLAGAERIVAVDILDDKLALARQLSPTATLHAAEEGAAGVLRAATRAGVEYSSALAGKSVEAGKG